MLGVSRGVTLCGCLPCTTLLGVSHVLHCWVSSRLNTVLGVLEVKHCAGCPSYVPHCWVSLLCTTLLGVPRCIHCAGCPSVYTLCWVSLFPHCLGVPPPPGLITAVPSPPPGLITAVLLPSSVSILPSLLLLPWVYCRPCSSSRVLNVVNSCCFRVLNVVTSCCFRYIL